MWTIRGGGDTQTLLAVQKYFEILAFTGSGDVKTLGAIAYALVLVPSLVLVTLLCLCHYGQSWGTLNLIFLLY